VYSYSEKEIRAGFDMSDRTIPLLALFPTTPRVFHVLLYSLKMEAAVSFETSASMCKSPIPEDSDLNAPLKILRRGKLDQI
jgi:hypothetical protein